MQRVWHQITPAVKHRLAWASLASVVLPGLAVVWARSAYQPGLAEDPDRSRLFVEILAIGVGVFSLSMVLTVAFGCALVAAMKGPRHDGDRFPSDRI